MLIFVFIQCCILFEISPFNCAAVDRNKALGLVLFSRPFPSLKFLLDAFMTWFFLAKYELSLLEFSVSNPNSHSDVTVSRVASNPYRKRIESMKKDISNEEGLCSVSVLNKNGIVLILSSAWLSLEEDRINFLKKPIADSKLLLPLPLAP